MWRHTITVQFDVMTDSPVPPVADELVTFIEAHIRDGIYAAATERDEPTDDIHDYMMRTGWPV